MTQNDINFQSSMVIHRHLAMLHAEYRAKMETCMNAVVAMEDSDFSDTDLGTQQLDDMYELLEVNESVTEKLEALLEFFEKFC